MGSTFGGSANDGLNQSFDLVHNYGDRFGGEIALDAKGIQWWAAAPRAPTPMSGNVPQPSFGGGAQDAILFTLNPR